MTEPKKKKQTRRDAPIYRQCPACFNGKLNGIGTAYSTHGKKTYYRCDRCGHTWTVQSEHQQTVIDHRTIDVQHQDLPPMGER